MKISYKNTALKFLESPTSIKIGFPEFQIPMSREEYFQISSELISKFSKKEYADDFKNNIQYITKPFYDAFYKGHKKIKQVVLKEPMNESGTIIINLVNHTQTMFYRIEYDGKGDDLAGLKVQIILFSKIPKEDTFSLDVVISLFDQESLSLVCKTFAEADVKGSYFIAQLMLLKTFMKYADVETKIINAERKDFHCGEKYVNETMQRVEILDSTYFTTISRTEGFGVSGHFRFQPYGPGMQQRRLQWISEFEKHGYTRKAKLL